MGYYTNIYGTITIKNPTEKQVNEYNTYLNSEEKYVRDALTTHQTNPIADGILDIDITADWKNYNNEIEGVCYQIMEIFPQATGYIECKGEDDDDMWRIEIDDEEMTISRASITWEDISQSYTKRHCKTCIHRLDGVTGNCTPNSFKPNKPPCKGYEPRKEDG